MMERQQPLCSCQQQTVEPFMTSYTVEPARLSGPECSDFALAAEHAVQECAKMMKGGSCAEDQVDYFLRNKSHTCQIMAKKCHVPTRLHFSTHCCRRRLISPCLTIWTPDCPHISQTKWWIVTSLSDRPIQVTHSSSVKLADTSLFLCL